MYDNDRLNKMMVELSDYEEDVPTKDYKNPCGKRIPYIGWFYRFMDFNRPLSIGKINDHPDGFVGFMINNKWGYPERTLTKQEQDKVMEQIEWAFDEYVGLCNDEAKALLEGLWDILSEFDVPS